MRRWLAAYPLTVTWITVWTAALLLAASLGVR